MIKLTTPLGAVYIRKNSIIAISATRANGQNNTVVNSNVWVEGQDEAFNLLEDVETIYDLLTK